MEARISYNEAGEAFVECKLVKTMTRTYRAERYTKAKGETRSYDMEWGRFVEGQPKYFYLIKLSRNFYKIGITSNLEARILENQIALSSSEPEILFSVESTPANIRKLETDIKNEFPEAFSLFQTRPWEALRAGRTECFFEVSLGGVMFLIKEKVSNWSV